MKHYQIRQSITDRSSISVDLYLKDIAKYPLLTDDEEKVVVERIKLGDDEAADLLIKSNLRFVVSIAKQYQGKGIELADLISCGNIGLLKAATRFHDSYGCKFLSYAVWWIRDQILKEIQINGKVIRVPSGKVVLLNRINKFINDFEQENQRPPSIKELSDSLDISEEEISDTFKYGNIMSVSDTVTNSDGETESIFETLYTEEGNTDSEIKREDANSSIIDILKSNLSKIEYDVVSKIFGLEGSELALDVIGEQHGITKERVRQIKDKAIIKLRKCPEVYQLNKYLG